jgi:large subunit ribosomal protein L5
MEFNLEKKYKTFAVPKLKEKFGYKNALEVPKIVKVVLNTGIGRVKEDSQRDFIEKQMSVIAGQHPSKRLAKKSIASFKTREGSHIGFSVTLRGKRMNDFLNKMVFVAIPRKRDFRGLDPKSIDESGNMTLGFKEHIVFPEMVGEDVKNTFGLEVTIVTTAKSKEDALELFKVLGFPFKKD